MDVNIQADLDRLHELGLLARLLEDKTTKTNIIWATDAYSDRGEQYQRDAKITSDLITGDHSGIIKTRARKELEQRSERTRQHAEVFTPLWVCDRMNNDIDEVWFGAKDVFNAGGEPTERIVFPEEKDWKQYVDSRRLEITCGEAPYLVSRYDVESGEILPITQRIGFLDRKLRIISENAPDEADWIKWAIRAVQATYGYEFQGDNLLIARTNLVMSFVEYYRARFGQEPDKPLLRKIVNIVSWNLWQMDGLTDKVPFNDEVEETISLLDLNLSEKDIQHCKIYDWRRDNALKFFKLKNTKERSTKDRKEVRSMKFDFIIGNPPYQEETENNGRQSPIYNLFMEASYGVSDCVELITPARFLFDAGQTPKAWNDKMLNDEHIKVLYYNPDPKEVFMNTEIKGGVAITIRNAKRNYGAIKTFTKYPELNDILHSVFAVYRGSCLDSIVSPRGTYRLTEQFFRDYPFAADRLGKGTGNMIASNFFEQLPEVWESSVSNNNQYYGILCRVSGQRRYCYILKKYVRDNDFIAGYNVASPKSNGNGLFGEALTATEIIEPNCGAADTFISIGSFKTLFEAEALSKYIKTKFMRTMLGIKKVTQDNSKNVWSMIPLQDFSKNSDIDWSKTIREIDKQLYAKYGLDANEIAFIESHVKEMA